MIGIAGIGLLACFAMKAFPLHTNTDENWGMEAESPDSPTSPSSAEESKVTLEV